MANTIEFFKEMSKISQLSADDKLLAASGLSGNIGYALVSQIAEMAALLGTSPEAFPTPNSKLIAPSSSGRWTILVEGDYTKANSNAKIIVPHGALAFVQYDGEDWNRVQVMFLPELEKWYGVEWNINTAAPEVARIGNLSDHVDLPVQSGMRRCLVWDDGTVNCYLSDTDSTKTETGENAVLDGSQGQVMVEIPQHYRRFEHDGDIRRVKISEIALAGFELVPKHYISAYEAALDRDSEKLSSVANETPSFRGGNDNEEWDTDARSLLGMPATNISLTNFRSFAKNRGDGWTAYNYTAHNAIFWLYLTEYANRDSQAPFTSNTTPEGYKSGGLGQGVVGVTSAAWTDYNQRNPVIKCGVTNPLGNATGTVDVEVSGMSIVFKVPSYRGIENPFAHIFKWTDGVLVEMDADAEEGTMYVCEDHNLFDSSVGEGYHPRGKTATSNGYMRDVIYKSFLASNSAGGSSSTFWCDYWSGVLPASGSSLRGVRVGGNANYGATAGLGCSVAYHAPSSASTHSGSRLCLMGVMK